MRAKPKEENSILKLVKAYQNEKAELRWDLVRAG